MKLAIIEPDGTLTGNHFTIKYHDMADVLDFLVLKQTYDIAVNRNWGPGDRFRCMIDDGWWSGQIEEKCPISPLFSESLFMSLRVSINTYFCSIKYIGITCIIGIYTLNHSILCIELFI